MKYETAWKPRTVGTEKTAGRNSEKTGIWYFRNRPHPKNHSTECVPMAEVLPTRRLSRSCSTSATRTSSQAGRSAETSISGLSSKRSLWLRICHRSVDLPTYRPVDREALPCTLPSRCDPTSDGLAGIFPLRSLSDGPSNVTRRPSSGGWSMTGQGSSVGPDEYVPTWFLSTKRAFCCTHWLARAAQRSAASQSSSVHGHLVARHQYFVSGLGIIGVSLRLADCLSHLAVTTSDGTYSWDPALREPSMWMVRSNKSRSLPLCAIFFGICRVRSLFSGIIWELTKVVFFVSGCVGAIPFSVAVLRRTNGFMWNTCRAMLLSLIPTSMDGPILRPILWRTTAHRMLINCMRRFWLQPKKSRVSSLCFVLLFMQPDFLLD